MNDFDQASRCAVKECPSATLRWLFPRLKPSVRYCGWLDAQSAPRPGEPDRCCDTIAELIDDEGEIAPWAAVVELFTEPDSDAIDRVIEYVGRFRRELRHGPFGRDRYQFVVALVFLTGASAETKVVANLPGMEEVGMWFGPRVLDLSAEDGVAHLEAIEQNRLARGLLAWVPLMKGGQNEETVKRWRALAEAEPETGLRNTLVDVAVQLAQLRDCRELWKQGLEGMVMNESISMREVRTEARITTLREATIKVLKARFRDAVPVALVDRVREEGDLNELDRWLDLASTATLEAFQADVGRTGDGDAEQPG